MSRTDYKKNMQEALSKVENLEVQAGSVSNLLWAKGPDGWKVEGVRLGEFESSTPSRTSSRSPRGIEVLIPTWMLSSESGESIKSSQVVICTGTFLGGE